MSHRENARPCASCGAPMEPYLLPDGSAEIDQCPSCGSVFLDFHDGEPSDLARSIERAGRHRPRPMFDGTQCPACRAPLELAPYLDTGPSISRCGECAGAFLTPAQLGQLADFRPAGERTPWLARLLERLRGR